MIIIIPLPLFFAQTIYGVGGLAGTCSADCGCIGPRLTICAAWVVIGLIWAFLSSFLVVLYPLWESREALGTIVRGLVKVRVCELTRGGILRTIHI
jgi:hypothetical protein